MDVQEWKETRIKSISFSWYLFVCKLNTIQLIFHYKSANSFISTFIPIPCLTFRDFVQTNFFNCTSKCAFTCSFICSFRHAFPSIQLVLFSAAVKCWNEKLFAEMKNSLRMIRKMSSIAVLAVAMSKKDIFKENFSVFRSSRATSRLDDNFGDTSYKFRAIHALTILMTCFDLIRYYLEY